jgi:hypothetical protein
VRVSTRRNLWRRDRPIRPVIAPKLASTPAAPLRGGPFPGRSSDAGDRHHVLPGPRCAGHDPHRTADLPGVKNRRRTDGDGIENAGPVTGPSLPPGDARRQAPGTACCRDRDARAVRRLGADPVPVLRLQDHHRHSRGPQASAPGPDPGGSGRSPAAPIVTTGAIVLVTDHERQCRRTASELAILRHSPAANSPSMFSAYSVYRGPAGGVRFGAIASRSARVPAGLRAGWAAVVIWASGAPGSLAPAAQRPRPWPVTRR